MADIDQGIEALNKSLQDLKKVQHDKDQEQINTDWNNAYQNINQAKGDLASVIEGDSNLKETAMKAFEAYKQAASDPTHHKGLDTLCTYLEQLVKQLKEKH